MSLNNCSNSSAVISARNSFTKTFVNTATLVIVCLFFFGMKGPTNLKKKKKKFVKIRSNLN